MPSRALDVSAGDVIGAVVFWAAILAALLWYVRRTKHVSRNLGAAYAVFLGIFGGIALGGITLVVSVVYALGLEKQQMPATISGVLALAVVFPAWRLAVRTIRRPASNSGGASTR